MRAVLGVMASLAMMMAAPAMAETGFMTVKGAKQGDIKGEVTVKGKEQSLAVLNFDYGVSGVQPGIRRAQQPVVITLRWTRATPLLLNAATSGESLSIKIKLFAPSVGAGGGGVETDSETVDIVNGRITSLKIQDRNGNEDNLEPVVIMSLAYDSLTLTHNEGGIKGTDSWGP